jgi:hypothetical protein
VIIANPSSFRALCDEDGAATATEFVESREAIAVSGQKLSLGVVPPRTPKAVLYLTGFSATATRAELAGVLDVPPESLESLRRGRRGMFTFVRLADVDEAQAVKERAEATTLTLGGHKLDIEYAASKERTFPSELELPTRRIHVTGFPASATRAQIAHALDVVEDAVIPPSVGSNGLYAFVDFQSKADATALLERCAEAPVTVDGAVLRLRYARSRTDLPSTDLEISGIGASVEDVHELLAPYAGAYDKDDVRISACHRKLPSD